MGQHQNLSYSSAIKLAIPLLAVYLLSGTIHILLVFAYIFYTFVADTPNIAAYLSVPVLILKHMSSEI